VVKCRVSARYASVKSGNAGNSAIYAPFAGISFGKGEGGGCPKETPQRLQSAPPFATGYTYGLFMEGEILLMGNLFLCVVILHHRINPLL
jgi:hypothetical protein